MGICFPSKSSFDLSTSDNTDLSGNGNIFHKESNTTPEPALSIKPHAKNLFSLLTFRAGYNFVW